MEDQRHFVVGGAGFIGSHLVDRLVGLSKGDVTVLDDLSTGRRDNVGAHLAEGRIALCEADAGDVELVGEAMDGHELVWHFGTHADARASAADTSVDLERGTLVTHAVLEAMRKSGVRKLVFASSYLVYGETSKVCSEEDLGVLPTSLHGAAELASEALISAYVASFGLQAWVLRLAEVVGARATSGLCVELLRRLAHGKIELEVPGDRRQAKPYLHVSDCVDGMLYALEQATAPLNVLNLTPAGVSTVARVAELCRDASPYGSAAIHYTGSDRAYSGDVPRARMSPNGLAKLGFSVARSSDDAVELGARELALGLFGARS